MRTSERGAAAAFSGMNGRPQALRRPMRSGQTLIPTASPTMRRGSRLRAESPEPRRLVEVGGGPPVVALGTVSEAALVVGVGKLGIELDRLVEVGEGVVEVALGAIREATIGVGKRVFGIEPDRFVVRRDGTVDVALGTIRVAAADIGGGVSGIESSRVIGLGGAVGATLQN